MDPPPSSANLIPAALSHASYSESVESSPRYRTTETWDDRESFSSTAPDGGGKLRLMCSYNGQIIPRPNDKCLSYGGGDKRMVVVDRNISLGELKARLSKNLLDSRAFRLKYQLPNEDLDSLISVTSDEDLENMIDEFDRICATSSVAKSSRLRVFLFTSRRESALSTLDGVVKSENGSKALGLGFMDSQSVNGDLIGVNFKTGNSREFDADLSKNQNQTMNNNQHESVTFDTMSLFGSTTSSLGNLPPVRVRVESRGGGVNGGNMVHDQRLAAVDEQFAQMGVSDEGFATMVSPSPIPTAFIPPAAVEVNHGMTVGELSEWLVDDDQRSDQRGTVGYVVNQNQHLLHSQSLQQEQRQQKPSGIFHVASLRSASSDGSMLYQDQVGHLPSEISRIISNHADSNSPRVQCQQKGSESSYLSDSQLETQQLLQQLQQQHHQNQQRHQNQQQLHQNQQQHQQNQQQHHQQQHQHHQQQQQHQQHQQHQQQQEHLQQQQHQQQEHLQQQQQQEHQQQKQQQHQEQQQQFVQPRAHYDRHPQNAVPISQYYDMYSPPSQPHRPQLDQQQYPFYFTPPTTRQAQQAYNMYGQQAAFGEPSNTSPSSCPQEYFHRAPQTMAQPQNSPSAANSGYAYEYSDPARAQMYSSQLLAQPAQYQTMASSSEMELSDASAAQNPKDNRNYQSSTQSQ